MQIEQVNEIDTKMNKYCFQQILINFCIILITIDKFNKTNMNSSEKIFDLEPLSVERFLNISDQLPLMQQYMESIDIVNILNNQSKCHNIQCMKSVQNINSMLLTPHSVDKSNEKSSLGFSGMVKTYNEEDKKKIVQKGILPKQIKQVLSQEQMIQQQQEHQNQNETTQVQKLRLINQQIDMEKIRQNIPNQMRNMINSIPVQYLNAMINLNNQVQFKTNRRIKVEKYLMKRRLKTWNKKICYNCRQKVAQQRLRIKGRFISRKKAMQMLQIKQKVTNQKLKALLLEKINNGMLVL